MAARPPRGGHLPPCRPGHERLLYKQDAPRLIAEAAAHAGRAVPALSVPARRRRIHSRGSRDAGLSGGQWGRADRHTRQLDRVARKMEWPQASQHHTLGRAPWHASSVVLSVIDSMARQRGRSSMYNAPLIARDGRACMQRPLPSPTDDERSNPSRGDQRQKASYRAIDWAPRAPGSPLPMIQAPAGSAAGSSSRIGCSAPQYSGLPEPDGSGRSLGEMDSE